MSSRSNKKDQSQDMTQQNTRRVATCQKSWILMTTLKRERIHRQNLPITPWDWKPLTMTAHQMGMREALKSKTMAIRRKSSVRVFGGQFSVTLEALGLACSKMKKAKVSRLIIYRNQWSNQHLKSLRDKKKSSKKRENLISILMTQKVLDTIQSIRVKTNKTCSKTLKFICHYAFKLLRRLNRPATVR